MNISKHITLAEATKSQTATRLGIDNTPNAEQLAAMKLVAEKVFEPIREHFGKPIHVSSFFRCDKLNKAVKGSKTSQHLKGEAIDLDADTFGGLTNKQIFDWVKQNLDFDQLLNEYDYSWVHVSYKPSGNRKQILSII